ncbi:hypothetical protein LMH87_003931 [Akanthomyces muscarius]|uniref:SET domain-containing protein n=1 Tax=Akanthomyces muscarius TaxID=2231603 RepID=A0A9W8Q2T0_AKAMU|nr:hypothetical protein LMH87_003931 [Akanthomyces muscarius]KAJ4145070.1 hypothetical protein LMH87_003931 [Akanthomyces muscarius]
MADAHQCSLACGPGSATRCARSIERERRFRFWARLRSGCPSRLRSGHQAVKHRRSSGRRASKPAWTPVEFPSGGAIQGAANNAKLQQNFEVLKIHETNTERRLGVVTRRALPKGYKVIHEPAAFSCYHWASGRRTAVAEWSELSYAHRKHMRLLYPGLRKVPEGGDDAFKERDKKRLETFISDYAFSDPQRDRAHIYELTCYINHACSSCANAEFWVDSDWPNSITVKLVRDVNKGDEIFICYHKPNLHFGCALCPQGQTLKGSLGRVLFFINNLGRRKRKANANETEPASEDAGTLQHPKRALPTTPLLMMLALLQHPTQALPRMTALTMLSPLQPPTRARPTTLPLT